MKYSAGPKARIKVWDRLEKTQDHCQSEIYIKYYTLLSCTLMYRCSSIAVVYGSDAIYYTLLSCTLMYRCSNSIYSCSVN